MANLNVKAIINSMNVLLDKMSEQGLHVCILAVEGYRDIYFDKCVTNDDGERVFSAGYRCEFYGNGRQNISYHAEEINDIIDHEVLTGLDDIDLDRIRKDYERYENENGRSDS